MFWTLEIDRIELVHFSIYIIRLNYRRVDIESKRRFIIRVRRCLNPSIAIPIRSSCLIKNIFERNEGSTYVRVSILSVEK